MEKLVVHPAEVLIQRYSACMLHHEPAPVRCAQLLAYETGGLCACISTWSVLAYCTFREQNILCNQLGMQPLWMHEKLMIHTLQKS